MKQILALTKRLLEAGETFSGGSHESALHIAVEWYQHGFTPKTMSSWIAIGVWDADVANEFVDNGLTPDQVFVASRSILQSDGNPYDAPQRWDSGCPIYHCCNRNDATPIIDEFIRLNELARTLQSDGFWHEADHLKS
jgi:hypothetical protein